MGEGREGGRHQGGVLKNNFWFLIVLSLIHKGR